MKKYSNIIFGMILILTSCNNSTQERKSFIESKPSFYELRFGEWTKNEWIRKPENLIMIHETFKKVGYQNLIGDLLSENPIVINDIYLNRKGYVLVDSLVLTYQNRKSGTKYYNEFWNRREKEKNDSIVFLILKDIKYSYKTKMTSSIMQLQADNNVCNDTLKQLIDIEYRYDTITPEIAIHDFETLKKMGFHQSAYNLLYERYKYQNIIWNRDSLEKTLTKSDKFVNAWFQDDTK